MLVDIRRRRWRSLGVCVCVCVVRVVCCLLCECPSFYDNIFYILYVYLYVYMCIEVHVYTNICYLPVVW